MNSRQPPSPPQQSPVQQYMASLDFSEPPDVQIIEASCALADTRNNTNSKWTNILKEPLLVKKGSQIRCASSFINMSGMDQEIIQFQPSGDNQDNSHTLLTQLYTCNDGTNGKTTSYDYIAHNVTTNSITLINGGRTVNNGTTAAIVSQSTGNGAQMTVASTTDYQIFAESINIVSAGTGYHSGDPITFGTGGGTQTVAPTGFVIADDFGAVKRIVMVGRRGYNNPNPGTAITATVSGATGGQGCTLTVRVPLQGDGSNQLYTFAITHPGTGYQVGELVHVENTAPPAYTENPVFRVEAVGPNGELLNVKYFDQGYNYARVPVYRWAQTFDFDDTYAYARNSGRRSFVANNGSTISVNTAPPLLQYDPGLSNAFNLGNREDEFCSGVFHQNAQASTFSIAKASISVAGDSNGYDFMMRTVNGISQFSFPNILEEYTDSYGKNLQLFQNPLNQLALGQCFAITFSAKNNAQIADETLWNNLQAVAGKFQGLYTVGQKTQYSEPITIGGVQYPHGYQTVRIGPVNQFNGGQIARVPGSNPPSYTGPQVGMPFLYQLAGTDNITGTPNQTYTVAMTNLRREDGEPMTGVGATVNITLNGAGNGWSSFSSNNNGTNYHQGDILTIAKPNGDPTTIEIYVLSIDGISGQTFFAAQGDSIDKSNLMVINNAGNPEACQINIVPQPMYMIGIGDVNNRPADNSFNYNPNAVGVIKDDARTGGCHFNNYPNFPPTFTNLGLQPSAVVGGGGGFQNDKCQSALCKPHGIQSDFTNYNNLTANFSAHSDSQFEVVSPTGGLVDYNATVTRTFTAGTDAATSEFYIGAVDPMPNNVFTFKILKATWANDPYTYPQSYVILKYTVTTPIANIEEHCYIQSVTVDATHLTFNLRARDIQGLECPLLTTDVPNWGDFAYRGALGARNQIESGTQVEMIFVNDWLAFNSRIHLKWANDAEENKPGTIGFTNNKNFYGLQDVNRPVLETSQDWDPYYRSLILDRTVLNNYQGGGYYYLTQATKMLGLPNSVRGQLADPVPYLNEYGFSQGLNEFPVGQPCTGQDINNPYFFSTYTNKISDIEGLWEYEKYLRQKTFKMEQNFQTPSSIGATWTRQAAELTGAIDQATGEIMAPQEQVGLLQNEFITPVYGSNNQIGTDGQYIKDLILYPASGGLEPGHCVGISGYDSNASYLATNILNSLPQDVNANSIYYVFFRTFFTIIRNYDPLKVTGNEPDRTPLLTLKTKAQNIGNVNNSGATPAVTNEKTLDGTTMIDVAGNGGANKNLNLFELGTPAPTAATPPSSFPSSTQEYPIRYIEQDMTGNLNRAKISNYIGANNLTLAFQQDISAFGFTFMHQAYVTPFVDNTGGTVSTRIFFGNRKLGIFNHDAFGGVSVVNYARPDFPRKVFTFQEIVSNVPIGDYTNGVDPLQAVAPVGRRFLQKLGFSDTDLGITKNSNNLYEIDPTNTKLAIQTVQNTRDIVLDDTSSVPFASFDTNVYGTTFAKIDSSDSILTSIPPPESSPGLASHVSIVTPAHGTSNRIIQKFGDYIFYPYSIDASTDSFNEASKVRYDNASSAFGTIGGLNLTSGTASRGMGTPNVLGSTTVVSQNTVPISLNPDCNIYLSYTIQADSNFINASNLPIKLNHGHMIVLSSLIQSPNYHLNNQGRLPGISIVNKTFLQGDYILSMGQLTFYAQKDQYISQITTEIVNNDYSIPSSLGLQSTVIYEVTNLNPKPANPPGTIQAKQQMGYLLNAQMQALQEKQEGGQPSQIQQLMGDLDRLGLGVLEDPDNNNSSVINQLGQYIRGFDLLNLDPHQRQQFYQSPQGQAFVQHAQSVMSMQRNLGLLEAQFQEQEDLLGQGRDPRQGTYQQVLTELAGLPGLPPIADVPVADAVVGGGVNPLDDYLDRGRELDDHFYDASGDILDIADPLTFMTYEQFVRDYVSTGPQAMERYLMDVQSGMYAPPPEVAPDAGAGGFAGVRRGGPERAESGVGTSVPAGSVGGGGAAPTETGTVDTGLGSEM